jgi:hypothetical protein
MGMASAAWRYRRLCDDPGLNREINRLLELATVSEEFVVPTESLDAALHRLIESGEMARLSAELRRRFDHERDVDHDRLQELYCRTWELYWQHFQETPPSRYWAAPDSPMQAATPGRPAPCAAILRQLPG